MKIKTAMQEFIEYLELTYGSLDPYIKEIYLEKEKEQIEDAFKQGQYNGNMYEERGFDTISSNQFYKQTYEVKMSKQSAVKWLVSILNKEGFAPVLTDEEIQQAKQMEKEQIVEAYQAGDGGAYSLQDTKLWGQEFYNEKYGGNNE